MFPHNDNGDVVSYHDSPKATEPTKYGLGHLKLQIRVCPSPFYRYLPQAFCYSYRKLSNSEGMAPVLFYTVWSPQDILRLLKAERRQ